MLKHDRYKNAIIFFIILALYFFLIFHFIVYYKANNKISTRSAIGLIILTIFLIQRLLIIYKQKKIINFIGNPLIHAQTTEILDETAPSFRQDEKRKKNIKRKLRKKLKGLNINNGLISKNEKSIFAERFTVSITNALFICTIAVLLVFYRRIILAYGIIGIGLAMFFGVVIAAYLTRNIKDIYNLYSKFIDTSLTRKYKTALARGLIKPVDEIIHFKNWTLIKNVTLCVVYDSFLKPVSFIFLFIGRYFLEGKSGEIINGIYEKDDLNFVFKPVSKSLTDKAVEIINTCEYINSEEREFIFKVLNTK